MAIVKFGSLVIGMRGTIGGITLTANASGPYARAWAKGPNPRSAAQSTTRANMSSFGAAWNAMSDAEREDWRTFATAPPETDYNSLGEIIYPSGWDWFCRINQRRISAGQAIEDTVPSDVAVSAPASTTLSLQALPGGTCTITWPNGTFGATDTAVLYLAFHNSVGLLAKNSQRLLTYIETNPGNGPIDISVEVAAKWGNIRAGWNGYAFLYKQRDDGVRSIAATDVEDVA